MCKGRRSCSNSLPQRFGEGIIVLNVCFSHCGWPSTQKAGVLGREPACPQKEGCEASEECYEPGWGVRGVRVEVESYCLVALMVFHFEVTEFLFPYPSLCQTCI